MAAEQGSMSVEQLLENVHVNLLVGKEGMTEKEARAEIRAAKAEKKAEALSEKQEKRSSAEAEPDGRAEREIAEFARNFPGVQLSDEQIEKMKPDVQSGMSMTNAYLKMENARLAAELDAQKQERERQQAAAAQNKKNRAKAPGSQRDSGGQRTKDAFDDFFDAYEK